MSLSINNMANKYMYTNSKTGQTRLNLDTSADGVWSKNEVENYAAEYETVTGKKLDADAVFDKYDADKSGTLDHSEYDKLLEDDALGAADLAALKAEADAALEKITASDEETNTAINDLLASLDMDASEVAELIGSEETKDTEETTEAGSGAEESSEPATLAEYMASLSDAERLSWIKATYKAESTTSLIQSFLDPDAALANIASAWQSYLTAAAAGNDADAASALDTQA